MSESLRLLQIAAEPGPATPMLERVAQAFAAPRLRGVIEQRLVLKQRHPSADRLQAGGIAVAALPFRSLLDFGTEAGLAEIAQITRVQAVLFWDRRGLARWPHGKAAVFGVLSDYGPLRGWARCDRLLALSDDLAGAAMERGWPAELARPCRSSHRTNSRRRCRAPCSACRSAATWCWPRPSRPAIPAPPF